MSSIDKFPRELRYDTQVPSDYRSRLRKLIGFKLPHEGSRLPSLAELDEDITDDEVVRLDEDLTDTSLLGSGGSIRFVKEDWFKTDPIEIDE